MVEPTSPETSINEKHAAQDANPEPSSPVHSVRSNPKTLSAHSRQARRRMRRAADTTTKLDTNAARTQPGIQRANTVPAQASHRTGPDNPMVSQMTRATASFVNLNTAFTGLLQPKHKLNEAPGWRLSALNTMRYSYMNVLLVFIPVSWALVSYF